MKKALTRRRISARISTNGRRVWRLSGESASSSLLLLLLFFCSTELVDRFEEEEEEVECAEFVPLLCTEID